MLDFKITSDGDLAIGDTGDIAVTQSVEQAVLVRLKWFFAEWRFDPALGVPYFEEVFVKNPNLIKIRCLLRDLVMEVEGVTQVTSVEMFSEAKTRKVCIKIAFAADAKSYKEEVEING